MLPVTSKLWGKSSFNYLFLLLHDAEAEDPDLDALLADICRLEEDTKKQLKTSASGSGKSENPSR